MTRFSDRLDIRYKGEEKAKYDLRFVAWVNDGAIIPVAELEKSMWEVVWGGEGVQSGLKV